MKDSRRGSVWLKKSSFLVWVTVAAIGMSGCSGAALALLEEQVPKQAEGSPETSFLALEDLGIREDNSGDVAVVSAGDCFLYTDGYTYAGNTLSESEQIWYRDIEWALGNMQGTVKLSPEGLSAGLDESHIDRIFQYVLNDHPEIFYVEGYTYTKYTRGDKVVAIDFAGTYNQDRETAVARKKEIESAVEEIIGPAREWSDDYAKIKYVYEILIQRTDYDVHATDNQNIYSVLVNRASVCQGYAKAFQYLMYRLNVECALVQGHVIETGEGHAWNLVKSNGSYYYVDPTWGDISYQDGEQGTDDSIYDKAKLSEDDATLPGVSYDYLCITTAQMQQTHELTSSEEMPECVDIRDNYYVREDALFTSYDEEQMGRLVDKRLSQGRRDISLRCSNRACYDEMQSALLDRQELFGYLSGSGIQTFVYSCNESQLTMTFFMMTSER